MSRQFDGIDDVVTFDPGAATGPQGPITIAVLIKPTDVGSTRCVVEGNTDTDAGYGLLIDSGDYYCHRQFTSPQAAAVSDWQWAVFSKASGSAPPRWHFRNVTDGGAWVHTDAASNSSNGPSPATHIRVGQAEFFTGRYAGSIAAIVVWGSVLTDGAVEAACTLAASDLADAAPAWGTLWNQASEAIPVADFTGGGGDQTSIVGTVVDPDDPPGFDYSLGSSATLDTVAAAATFSAAATPESTATLAGTASAATFAATATATAAVALSATASAASLSVTATSAATAALGAVASAATFTAAAGGGGTVVHPPRIGTVTRPDTGVVTVPRVTYP